jgi:hypothetical protein
VSNDVTKASLANLANAPKRRRSTKPGTSNKAWAQSQKIECVLTYLATGSEVKTAAATGIPKNTIHIWRYQPWWKELVQQIRDEEDDKLTADLAKIVDKAIVTVEDRLVNGDFGFNQKTGEIFRKPVNLKDAHKVAVDMMDQRAKISGRAVEQTEKLDTMNQLEFLAKKFAEFATMSKKDLKQAVNADEIIDIETVESPDEQSGN